MRDGRGNRESPILALGDQFGGYSLYLKDGEVVFMINRVGDEFAVRVPTRGTGATSVSVSLAHIGPTRGPVTIALNGKSTASEELSVTGSPLYALTDMEIWTDRGGAISSEYRRTNGVALEQGLVRRIVFRTSPPLQGHPGASRSVPSSSAP